MLEPEASELESFTFWIVWTFPMQKNVSHGVSANIVKSWQRNALELIGQGTGVNLTWFFIVAMLEL